MFPCVELHHIVSLLEQRMHRDRIIDALHCIMTTQKDLSVISDNKMLTIKRKPRMFGGSELIITKTESKY